MRNLLGFLDKFRNRYWFNFLVFCGFLTVILISIYVAPIMSSVYIDGDTESFLIFGIYLILISLANLVLIFISFLIWIFEKMLNIKRLNECKINKHIQNLGIFFFFLPPIIWIFVFIKDLMLNF
jgi:hypothetical protein